MRVWSFGLVALLVSAAGPASAQPPRDRNPSEEAALLKRAEAFVEAFHNGDAKAVAAFWAPDGDYTDQAGHHLQGREAIEKRFQGLFAENKGLKLRIDIASLRFMTPDVAVEDGTTSVLSPDGAPPSRARYTVVHVKKDNQWYLGSVRDAAFAPPTNYEQLKELEWAVGEWADEAAQGEVARAAFAWTPSQNFLTSTYTTTFKNTAVGGGTQWIGWDPTAKRIRSWTFNNDGGFGDGTWTREGANRWVITSATVLRDGKKAVATIVLTRVDADTMTWHSRGRTLDGEVIPDGKEITLKRQK